MTRPPPIFTPTLETFFVNSVSMWQETLPPVINELEPSGSSPVQFFAREDLDTFTLDLFAFRTLAETSSSRIDLAFGAKIARLETNQAQGFTERAFVFAEQKGRFTDIDDISATPSPTGPFTPVLLIRSDIPFSKSETVFIPVTEFQLKLKVEITKNVAIGANGLAAIWLDAPVTPTFTSTHAPAGPGLNWKLEERTLRFLGASLDLQIRF